jgi:hypothetical protein
MDLCRVHYCFVRPRKWLEIECAHISPCVWLICGRDQLAYESNKARLIIRSRDISFAYTNIMANDYYSVRDYDYFCFWCHVSESEKKKDVITGFVFFTFKGSSENPGSETHLSGTLMPPISNRLEETHCRGRASTEHQRTHALLLCVRQRLSNRQSFGLLGQFNHHFAPTIIDDRNGPHLARQHVPAGRRSSVLHPAAVLYPRQSQGNFHDPTIDHASMELIRTSIRNMSVTRLTK